MADARVEEVRIDCIVKGDRVRPRLSENAIIALMESMREIGLINPISIVRPRNQPQLITGAHRLEAARRLGWETIRCTVVPSSEADSLKLAEIDENLVREDLTPAERAIHVAARKEVYERLHPETKHGATGKHRPKSQSGQIDHSEKPSEDNDLAVDRFTADTAKKTGKPERTTRRAATRAKKIPKLAEVVGTCLDKGDELDALAKLPEERQGEVIAKAVAGDKVSAKTEVKKVKREEKEVALAEKTAEIAERIGHQIYNVIYADPNWRFEPYSRETGMDRAADNHYPTNELEAIKALDVPGACAADCALFLWATAPMLPQALEVMSAWGFEYKSHLIWGKNRVGTGYWVRNKHELLLIGTKGNIPAPAPGTQPESLIMADVAEHSRKPVIFYEIIEKMFPNVPKLEMYARSERAGWDAWGNEVDLFGQEAA